MKTVSAIIQQRLTRFNRDQDGNIAIEAAIILPVLFWAYLTMFSIFDSYRQYTVSQKAAYTIADLVSRQNGDVDSEFLDGSQALFEMLTRSIDEPSMRLTVVKYDEDSNEYSVNWSKTRGDSFGELTTEMVKNWHNILPVMPDQEVVVVLETQTEYDPPFNIGLEQRTIKNFVFTRLRYAPNICWEGVCNS
jgi:hypothetical protein